MPGTHPKDKKVLTCWMDTKNVSRLDELAAKAGLTRAKLAENMLEIGIDQLEVLRTLGVMSTALVLRDLKDAIQNWGERKAKETGVRLIDGC